jgi:hypothetical protein
MHRPSFVATGFRSLALRLTHQVSVPSWFDDLSTSPMSWYVVFVSVEDPFYKAFVLQSFEHSDHSSSRNVRTFGDQLVVNNLLSVVPTPPGLRVLAHSSSIVSMILSLLSCLRFMPGSVLYLKMLVRALSSRGVLYTPHIYLP